MLHALNASNVEPSAAATGPVLLASPRLSLLQVFGAAAELNARRRPDLAAALYARWIDRHQADPDLFAAYFNQGLAFKDVGETPKAIEALRHALRLRPDFHPAAIVLGELLEQDGDLGQAADVWACLVARLAGVDGDTTAYRGTALSRLAPLLDKAGDFGGAEEALSLRLSLTPTDEGAAQQLASLRLRRCRWAALRGASPGGGDLVSILNPFLLAHLSDDPLFQLATARRFNRCTIGVPAFDERQPSTKAAKPARGRKIRLGYVSADFKDHAGGFAMTEVMDLHDRRGFEVFAYSCGEASPDRTQRRIRAAVDRWTDIGNLDDRAAARAIADDEIDILVDLKGYSASARTRVFALRPAPVAVNWFGYPGSMGSPYHHYIVADDYIIPRGSEVYYSETVLRLPCYQPNDRQRLVSPATPSRPDEGLPPGAMVFCCFNGPTKLTQPVFHRWMTILRQVPGSVLWLLAADDETNARLRAQASDLGVAPERLIFAKVRPNADHLARYPLADLFLDTFPCGAHTTAAECLWMGVPLLTLAGRGFASRVCGSVVTAAGVGELACETAEAYVATAIELGFDRARRETLRQRLKAQRDTCPLFDTPRLVHEVEGLYRRMMEDLERGRRPVPNLDNLDVYREIGAGLALDPARPLSDAEYYALYRGKLSELHDFSPLRDDARLWPGQARAGSAA